MINWKRFLGFFIAMNGIGSGVALFLHCGLGCDPIGILCDGIHRALNIQFGHASLLYNFIIIAVAMLLAKKNIGIGTIAYGLLSGYFIDFYYWILEPLQFGALGFSQKFQIYLVGQLLVAMSFSILIQYRLGMNALDAIIYKLEAVTKIPYAVLRTICDVSYTAIGFLLGGVFGVGTMVSVFTTGILVGMFTKTMATWNLNRKALQE